MLQEHWDPSFLDIQLERLVLWILAFGGSGSFRVRKIWKWSSLVKEENLFESSTWKAFSVDFHIRSEWCEHGYKRWQRQADD